MVLTGRVGTITWPDAVQLAEGKDEILHELTVVCGTAEVLFTIRCDLASL